MTTELEKVLRRQLDAVQLELEQVQAVRRSRAEVAAAEVVEGLAAFAIKARSGDKQATANLKALAATLQEARAVLSGIELPPGSKQQ